MKLLGNSQSETQRAANHRRRAASTPEPSENDILAAQCSKRLMCSCHFRHFCGGTRVACKLSRVVACSSAADTAAATEEASQSSPLQPHNRLHAWSATSFPRGR